jgi:ring-1,2-phenylacetyl-CoA epoxidase subunit PaaD
MVTEAEIKKILEQVPDPEIPVLSIAELGILRDVALDEQGNPIITITPTYSGCPAMNAIEVNIKAELQEHGIYDYKIMQVLSPAWTTDWISEAAKEKLRLYGIAPPVGNTGDKNALTDKPRKVPCPRCESLHTEMVSQFGSTSCKSLYKCLDCKEPFDYFKCH